MFEMKLACECQTVRFTDVTFNEKYYL